MQGYSHDAEIKGWLQQDFRLTEAIFPKCPWAIGRLLPEPVRDEPGLF